LRHSAVLRGQQHSLVLLYPLFLVPSEEIVEHAQAKFDPHHYDLGSDFGRLA
ncbi:hypothetical protein BDZ91DRAFT_717915, partial [Kalaharituber pfeilii]